MTEISFWLLGWEHECCGDQRKVGDWVRAQLACEGSVEPSDEPSTVEVHRDGTMTVVGSASDLRTSQPAWLIDSGDLKVSWSGKEPGKQVRFDGKLMEERHDERSAEASGTIKGIRWHKAIYEKIGDVQTVVGYEGPQIIYNTERRPGYPVPIPPGIAKMRPASERGELKGPFTFKAAPMDDWVPTGWAFQFIVEL